MMEQLELSEQEKEDILHALAFYLHAQNYVSRRSTEDGLLYQRLENLEEKLRASQSGL